MITSITFEKDPCFILMGYTLSIVCMNNTSTENLTLTKKFIALLNSGSQQREVQPQWAIMSSASAFAKHCR